MDLIQNPKCSDGLWSCPHVFILEASQAAFRIQFLKVSHCNFFLTCSQDFHVFSNNKVAALANWPDLNPELYFPSFSCSAAFPYLVSAFLPKTFFFPSLKLQ